MRPSDKVPPGLGSAAFTLVELLVVIAIIGLLATLIMPGIQGALDKSRRAACASNLRQNAASIILYHADTRTFPDGRWDISFVIRNRQHVTLRDEYGLSKQGATCPTAAPFPSNRWDWNSNEAMGKLTYYYWGGEGEASSTGSPAYFDGWYRTYFPGYQQGVRPYKSLGSVRAPNYTPLMSDLAYDSLDEGNPYVHKPARSNHQGKGRAAGNNILFYDGHVEWHELDSQSWMFARDFYDRMYWSPSSINPPASPVFFN